MHTIHESNYTVIKLPRDGNSKAKKLIEEALADFYTYHQFVDCSKRMVFVLGGYQFLECRFTQILLCKSLRVYEWLDRR